MTMRWYVVHAYSGYEKRVQTQLKERIELHNMQDKFGEVLVPTEEVVEVRDGKKRKSERKFYPGYVLVEMDMDDDSWHLVNQTPRVMGFIGGTADKPAPISKKEADAILRVFRMVLISLHIKPSTKLVKWFVLLMVRLQTLTVWLKPLITRSLVCRWR